MDELPLVWVEFCMPPTRSVPVVEAQRHGCPTREAAAEFAASVRQAGGSVNAVLEHPDYEHHMFQRTGMGRLPPELEAKLSPGPWLHAELEGPRSRGYAKPSAEVPMLGGPDVPSRPWVNTAPPPAVRPPQDRCRHESAGRLRRRGDLLMSFACERHGPINGFTCHQCTKEKAAIAACIRNWERAYQRLLARPPCVYERGPITVEFDRPDDPTPRHYTYATPDAFQDGTDELRTAGYTIGACYQGELRIEPFAFGYRITGQPLRTWRLLDQDLGRQAMALIKAGGGAITHTWRPDPASVTAEERAMWAEPSRKLDPPPRRAFELEPPVPADSLDAEAWARALAELTPFMEFFA